MSKYSRHVVLCKNKKTKKCHNKNSVGLEPALKIMTLSPQDGSFLKKEKKNGAHNHLSQLKKLRASKYSRHVVLCKNNVK